MAFLIGIDAGTSSLKTMLVSETGEAVALSSRHYQYDSPQAGYAEQDPETWRLACVQTIAEVLQKSGVPGDAISGAAFSGQMHGAVFLDECGNSIRPAILHCDTRSIRQVEQLKQLFGREKIAALMRNPVYTGFLLCSLLWVRDNEPENFKKIRKVCLPKDYIKYKLCGELCTDFSDASGTLAFDIARRTWSSDILSAAGIPLEFFPPVCETHEAAGSITQQAERETGLGRKVIVVSGGADQVMQGIGCGATRQGIVTSNIGSSGQICFQCDSPVENKALSTNLFCGYKKGRWIAMGAIMHAGLALKWFSKIAGCSDYAALDEEASRVSPGSGGLVFLPFLNGERTPHMNPALSALFLGCSAETGRAEMARSVMEGVAFALRQCIETCAELGLKADMVIASGGGAHSRLWRQIQADVFGLPLKTAETEEQACLGAAIAAGTGTHLYSSIEEGCAAAVRFGKNEAAPCEKNHKIYDDCYAIYKEAFAANRRLLEKLTGMRKGEA
jgi:xylulokinase